jgi:integrase
VVTKTHSQALRRSGLWPSLLPSPPAAARNHSQARRQATPPASSHRRPGNSVDAIGVHPPEAGLPATRRPDAGKAADRPLTLPEIPIHEITNKYIKALVSVRKLEKASHWTIKHELQTLRAAIQLARDLGYQVNTDINWPTKDLKTKRGRLRFLTKEEEQTLLVELDPNHGGRGLALVEARSHKKPQQMQDNYDFVIALLDTGMRYDEIAKLPWSAVDIDTGIIRIYRNKVGMADNSHMTDRLKQIISARATLRCGH